MDRKFECRTTASSVFSAEIALKEQIRVADPILRTPLEAAEGCYVSVVVWCYGLQVLQHLLRLCTDVTKQSVEVSIL